METATELRKAGSLRVDLYPDVAKKMDRIFKYVDQRKARFIAILGSDEIADGTVTLRNVATKAQRDDETGGRGGVHQVARRKYSPSSSA